MNRGPRHDVADAAVEGRHVHLQRAAQPASLLLDRRRRRVAQLRPRGRRTLGRSPECAATNLDQVAHPERDSRLGTRRNRLAVNRDALDGGKLSRPNRSRLVPAHGREVHVGQPRTLRQLDDGHLAVDDDDDENRSRNLERRRRPRRGHASGHARGIRADEGRHGALSRARAARAEEDGVLVVRAVDAVRREGALARDARLESLELDGSAPRAHGGGDANPRRPALVVHELPLPREHEPRPRHLLVDRPVVDDALLVPPVRRHARLSRAVHLGGANLHLNRRPIRGDDDGVQALVAVHLGVAHVVLGLARDRGELAVDSLEGGVAVVLRVDDDANRPQVVHVAERDALAEHLAVHRKEALGAAVDVVDAVGDARVGDDGGGDVLDGALHRRLLLVPRELGAQRVVRLRVQVRETRILEARLEAPDAEARREGDVDGEGFLGDSRGGVLAERVDGLEALEPIRELDDDDSRIRHRDEQRAELQAFLSRQGPAAGALELGHERELGNARHHGHDGVRRRVPELALRHRRVVEDVVE
mmetsp:Transcript_10138/g.41009  ORF Transcript_10138/g.41009 Transcript_10138/m.41009 type:complete len:534 (+) Transcript_10138:170-1771(+)